MLPCVKAVTNAQITRTISPRKYLLLSKNMNYVYTNYSNTYYYEKHKSGANVFFHMEFYKIYKLLTISVIDFDCCIILKSYKRCSYCLKLIMYDRTIVCTSDRQAPHSLHGLLLSSLLLESKINIANILRLRTITFLHLACEFLQI